MTASEPAEIEIKFLLPDAAATAALEGHPVLRRGEAGPPTREKTAYFDTADRAFARVAASFRLRRAGGRAVQTLKLRNSGSPFGRDEWEWVVKGGKPDLRRLADTPLAGLKGELIAVFTAEVVRTLRRVWHEGATIEITVDDGTLRAGSRAEPMREAELELKEGRPVESGMGRFRAGGEPRRARGGRRAPGWRRRRC